MNYAKSFYAALSLSTLLAVAISPPVTAALVAAYSFNEPSGTQIYDMSGNSNNLTQLATTSVSGKNGAARNFNTSVARATISDKLSLVPADLSIEAWIRKDSNTSQEIIVAKGGVPGTYETATSYRFVTINGELSWVWSGGNRYHTTSGANILPGNWYHVAITFSDAANTVKIYLNGVQRYTGTETSTIKNVSGDLLVGSRSFTSYFRGAIDDLRIYNTALTQAEVQQDMLSPVAVVAPAPTPTPTPDPAPAPAPAPVPSEGPGPITNLAPGTWYQIPNSKLSSVDPCPTRNCTYSGDENHPAVMNDWNGGAYDTVRNRLVVWGGGHHGYAGNEIYAFDVLGTQQWARLTQPTLNPLCNQATGLYQDNTPCAAHTYDYVDYHANSHSFIELGSTSNFPEGAGGAPSVNLFNFDSNQWRQGTPRPGPATNLTGASSAYDPTRDVFWVLPAYNQRFAMYDPNANSAQGGWTLYNAYNIDINTVSAIDPDHDIMVTVDGRGMHNVKVFDLKNPNAVPLTAPTSGNKIAEDTQSAGFEWNPVIKKFVAWLGGTSVYTLDPVTWVWTEVTPATSNTVTPTLPNATGTFSRFRFMPALNAFIVVNRTTDNVFIYKLPESGTSTVPPVTPPPADEPPPPPADEPPVSGVYTPSSFASRSSAPGVVYAQGFDTLESVTAKQFPAQRPNNVFTYDYVKYATDQKSSGAGALKFIIPSRSSANSSGAWRTNFTENNSIKFGANEDVYVQWRQRFDNAMLDTVYNTASGGNGGWKQLLLGEGDYVSNIVVGTGSRAGEVSSCTTLEVVVNNGAQRHLPSMYHSCGTYQGFDELFVYRGNYYYKLQNAIDKGAAVDPIQNRFVLYPYELARVNQLRTNSPAVDYYANEWMTFQVHLRPGPLGTAMDSLTRSMTSGFTNSTVELWVAREGEAAVLTHRFTGVVLRRNAGATANDEKYGKLWLTPYHTDKDINQEHAEGNTWIDELIVSRTRVVDP